MGLYGCAEPPSLLLPQRRSPRKQQPLEKTNSERSVHHASPTKPRDRILRTTEPRTTLQSLETSQHLSEATLVSSADSTIQNSRRLVLGELPIPVLAPPTSVPAIPKSTTGNYTHTSEAGLIMLSSVSATSNNRGLSPRLRESRISPSRSSYNQRLPHVDSLLLPLSKQNLTREATTATKGTGRKQMRSALQFISSEANCDDSELSDLDEDEESETDLSGFIVDDDADLSVYADSDVSPAPRSAAVDVANPTRRRRLCRGRPTTGILIDKDSDEQGSDKENDQDGLQDSGNMLARAIAGMTLSSTIDATTSRTVGEGSMKQISPDIIDLTSSPEAPVEKRRVVSKRILLDSKVPILNSPKKASESNPKTCSKQRAVSSHGTASAAGTAEHNVFGGLSHRLSTPPLMPVTPPRGSPSKLKLSPSKRPAIPHSPHRQSTDAFWDLNEVNDWNETYSPKKTIGSPKKGVDRFKIWEDLDVEVNDDEENSDESSLETQDSLPTPCTSPRKRHGLPTSVDRSPTKASPSKLKSTASEREERKRIAETKKTERERKRQFEAHKDSFAQTLLSDLDNNVTDGKLRKMSASTGGVKITWSKTLRSTAGRANWRRTVTKPTGSPMKGDAGISSAGVKVQHYASIELAEKVIDSEERLVNTLAHEFCHLANFMVSGIRERPHGVEFKQWAAKATKYLRSCAEPVRQGVEVSTKHGYVIEYRYMWVCIGQVSERTSSAKNFLKVEMNLEDGDGGCGAEYGRHSKSIDIDRQRCGRCKGRLVQVRPKPRAESPVKKLASPSKKDGLFGRKEKEGAGGMNLLSKMMEAIELDV